MLSSSAVLERWQSTSARWKQIWRVFILSDTQWANTACSETRQKTRQPKGRELSRAALHGWEEQVVDTQPCEQPLSPPCSGSVLFAKDKRTWKKMKNIPCKHRPHFTRHITNTCKQSGQGLQASQFTAHNAKSNFDFDLLRPLNWCTVAFRIITCTLHHTQTSPDIRMLVFAGSCKKTQSTPSVSAEQTTELRLEGLWLLGQGLPHPYS